MAEDWVAVKALAVLAGDSARVAADITAEADNAGQRHGADTCVRYLAREHEFLRCDQALAAGWPIATSVIEGLRREGGVADAEALAEEGLRLLVCRPAAARTARPALYYIHGGRPAATTGQTLGSFWTVHRTCNS